MQETERPADVEETGFLEVGEGARLRRIAWRRLAGSRPTTVWLGGFRSDMQSTKAERLAASAAAAGRGYLRFDYGGHGESGGRFEELTLSDWLEDALTVIEALTSGPVVLVGSSMGGWLSLLASRRLPRGKLAGLVLIAPAVDFTEALMWDAFPAEIREQIRRDGVWLRPSAYSAEPYPITRALIEDGRRHLLLGSTLRTGCPVQILQGMRDPDVPWQHALKLVEHLPSDPVTLTLVNDGDHRLSREQDIDRLIAAVDAMVEGISAG